MENTKSWYLSKGVMGSALSGLGGIAMVVQAMMDFFQQNPDAAVGISNLIQVLMHNPMDIVVIIGSFVAWYGRMSAKTTIGK